MEQNPVETIQSYWPLRNRIIKKTRQGFSQNQLRKPGMLLRTPKKRLYTHTISDGH